MQTQSHPNGEPRVEEALRRLRAESDTFAAELGALSPEDWDRPTHCEPWTVRVLVGHVVRGAESFLTSLERGLVGNLEPAFTPEQRTRRMHEIAAQEPGAILADFRAITDRFEREFGAFTPAELDTLGAHPYGPRPARWFPEQRLAEILFHRWDVAHALDRPAALGPDTTAFLLPMLLEQNLPAMMGAEGPRGRGSFRFVVRGAGSPAWQIVAAPPALTVTPGGTGHDASIEGDPEALALLVYGRQRLPELERRGDLTIRGDRGLADRFHEIFRGP